VPRPAPIVAGLVTLSIDQGERLDQGEHPAAVSIVAGLVVLNIDQPGPARQLHPPGPGDAAVPIVAGKLVIDQAAYRGSSPPPCGPWCRSSPAR